VSDAASPRAHDETRLLWAFLLLLVAVVWLQPDGSGLAEPDETRYAEIPREMLASGDFTVPRLNGLPYFEKPPLLYWVNAASLRIFGENPWAARLPTRLAGFATVCLIVLAGSRRRGTATGLAAGILFLASPMGFLFSRTNLTDGLLTLFFTATVLCGAAAVRRREVGKTWKAMAALTGAAAAGAFLTKGLIALALPGAILLLWCLFSGRLASLPALILSPAPVVFLVLAAPWFLLVERRQPGFLQFFFIHEHFQRFATQAAKRPGPITYFVPVFILGFLPGLPFLFAGLRPGGRLRGKDGDSLLWLLWFAAVFVFFSISRSKLPPYLFPAIPAAALLAAGGVRGSRRAWPWIVQAALATALAFALVLHPALNAEIRRLHLAALVAPFLALFVLASWAAVLLARSSPLRGLAAIAVAWATFSAAVALGWPRIPRAHFTDDLAAAARSAAAGRGALIVGYRDYLNGFSWSLKSPIPVAGYRGELEPEFETSLAVRDSLIWPAAKFWSAWRSRPLVVLVRMRDLVEMMTADPPARVVRFAEGHAVVVNFPEERR
jgi:4-amino-4-deoxy-L-arabinose transferase-like glycosyltransferase